MCKNATSEENCALTMIPAVVPKAHFRVASVSHLPGFKLQVLFNDGTQGIVSMAGLINSPRAGVFAALRDEEFFSKVSVHLGAVTWPGELDVAPDAMYEAISRNGEYVLD